MKYILIISGVLFVGVIGLYTFYSENVLNRSTTLQQSRSDKSKTNVSSSPEEDDARIENIERSLSPNPEQREDLTTVEQSFEVPVFSSKEEAEFMKRMLLSNSGFTKNDLEASGFTSEGASLFSGNSAVISINDMSPELKEVSLLDLENYNQRGYWHVGELFADEIVGVMNYIIGTDHESANIDFTLSEIPPSITANYEYMGFTHPNYSINPDIPMQKNGTMRRVFSAHDTTNILVMEESSNFESGRVVLTEEYVNESVKGRPAIFHKKKSASGNEFMSLHWTTDTHSYNLYQVGSSSTAPNTLLQIAGELGGN